MAMQDNLDTETVQGSAADWFRRIAAGFRAAPIRAPHVVPRLRASSAGTAAIPRAILPRQLPDQAMPEPLLRRAAPFDLRGAQAADFDLIETSLLAERHVVLVGGFADQSLLDHSIWLQEQVADLQSAADLDTAAAMVAPLAEDTGLLVVDIDALRADTVTMLQGFRDRYPDVAVVIGSRRFARNDFSCERALIADASLRLPARRIAFALAMSSAIHNNRMIRSR